jgi:cytochrome P450
LTGFEQERWVDASVEFLPGQASQTAGEVDSHQGSNQGDIRRYYPFGIGERDCPGRNLANMTVTATLAYLLSRFSFQLAEKVTTASFP